MPMHLFVDAFYGFVSSECAWSDAEDFDAAEDWEARLSRRLEALERSPSELSEIGVACDFEQGSPWWIYVKASHTRGSDVNAAPITHGFEIQSPWTETLRDFCRVMGVPWSEPGWCVASQVV
jgi:hypothetical protein